MNQTAVKRKATASTENATAKKLKSESRKEQKSVREERKGQDKYYKMITEAKKIWEKLRRGDNSKEENKQLMAEIMKVITGHVQEVIFKHDASRIIQTCLKKGNAEQRNQIVSELEGKFVVLSKSMYGKFITTKALEYCKRAQVLSEFHTQVAKLVRHKEASTVIETFYAQYANGAQRKELVGEFYGPEMTLFSRNGGPTTLEELLEKMPDKKESILKHMAETIHGCIDKGTIQNSIVHKALHQYLTFANEKQRKEMMGLLRDNIQDIVHTREGSWAAQICISYASPKDRKAIIKNCKPYLAKIAVDEYGYLVLLRLLDVMDDTVLLNKAVTNELCKQAKQLFADKFGRRFFLYILVGRDTKYFSVETVKQLNAGDEIRQSKKDAVTRHQEILEGASPQLIDLVAQNAAILIREKLSSQVVQEIMLHALGDKTAAINAILELAGENIEKENHVIEDRFANRVIKALIKADNAEEANQKAIESLGFASKLLEVLKPNLGHFATNFGSYVVLALAEEESTKKETLKALKAHKKAIKAAAEENEGAKLLLELL